MIDNPNIDRITFEEIQEFKDLNLFDITENTNPNEAMLLVYDPPTKKFTTGSLDINPGSGNVTIYNDAKLTKDVIVNTDDLSVKRGFVFKKDTDFTQFVELLCNPKISATLSMSATPSIIEINTGTIINLNYIYIQNDGGLLDITTLVYYRELIVTTNGELTSISAEKTVPYSMFITMLASSDGTYPEDQLTATTSLRSIYPNFINTSIDGSLPNSLANPRLIDIAVTDILICEFDQLSSTSTYFYFAVSITHIPVSWVEIDANGVEDALNSGPIETAFTNIGNTTYKNNSYAIWMSAKTTFSNRIKIKF